MPMLDVFNGDEFSVTSLTASINKMPFVPGQIGKAGIFHEDGVYTTSIVIEERDGQLSLVGSSPRGGAGETVDKEQRKARMFAIPHFQRDDAVLADEVQNVRAFGSEGGVMQVQELVDTRMAKHTMAFDATLEHQRVGATKGLVVDKNGIVLADLYGQFGLVAPAAFQFTFSSSTFDLREKAFEVNVAIEDALDGDPMGEVHAFVGKGFWANMISHPSVEKTYLNWLEASALRTGLMKDAFDFGDVIWHRYRSGKQATASVGSPFIADNEARFVVKGVPDLFITRFAPADYNDTVNTKGLPRYAQQTLKTNNKGIDLDMQMNAISLCTRPEALQSGTAN